MSRDLFLAAIAALYLGSSLTHWLGLGAKLGQSYTTKGRPHIETWGLHKDIKDINVNDNNNDDDNNNNNNKDDNDNNKDDNDNKGNTALGLDRSQGFRKDIMDISNNNDDDDDDNDNNDEKNKTIPNQT